MTDFLNTTDFNSTINIDEKSENILSLDEKNTAEFEECFQDVFNEKKIIDLDLDKDNESYFFMQEKANFQVECNNITENKENMFGISKEKKICLENEKDILNDLSSNTDSDKLMLMLKENIDENIIIFADKVEKIVEENNKSNKKGLLGKKRYFFKIDNQKDFVIFNCGQYNKFSAQIINEVRDELKKNIEDSEKDSNNSFKKKKLDKRIRNVQKRKENSDNIRKKIKCRFFKDLKNAVNERLKVAGSEQFFRFLPQNFICNISKSKNKAIMNLTFKEIFSKNLYEKENAKEADFINYSQNLSAIEYLEKNKEIREKSNYNIFKNMKINQIFNEYLKSKEFEMEIAGLRRQKESDKYIKDYIIKASDFIDFFSN